MNKLIVLGVLTVIVGCPVTVQASDLGGVTGRCVLTSEGVVLRGQVEAASRYTVTWNFAFRDLPDGEWNRTAWGTHERIDTSGDGYVRWRFRSDPRRTDGRAYKLVIPTLQGGPYFIARYNDSKPNGHCADRTAA